MPPSSSLEFTARRPVAILMVAMTVALFGWVSLDRLTLDLMPDISYPRLTVRVAYPGAAPEEVETLICRPIEEVLGVVGNLSRITSTARAELGEVVLEFSWDTRMEMSLLEVREKLDQIQLPDDAGRPLLLRYDPSLDPLLRLGVHGNAGEVELRRLAEDVLRRGLEVLPGVAAVRVRGGLEEEIRVELRQRDLTQVGLDLGEVQQRLAQENINLAGGTLREGGTEYLVRTLNEFRSVEEIGHLEVARRDGAQIRLQDLGEVRRVPRKREVITSVQGRPSVELEVFREADANLVEVARQVRERVFGRPPSTWEEAEGESWSGIRQSEMSLEGGLPRGVEVQVLSDRSVFVRDALAGVRDAALTGCVLAVIVLYAFLRHPYRSFIITLSIPLSLLASFAGFFLAGVSLNIMSLGGLALGAGMLVDNSIVVLESISRRREAGEGVTAAAVLGAGDVASAVAASTLTTVAVFFPIVFVEGIAGQVFRDQALAVVFSLMASLAVALFLIPMLASRSIQVLGAGGRHDRLLRKPASIRRLEADWEKGGLRLLWAFLFVPVDVGVDLTLRLLEIVLALVLYLARLLAGFLGLVIGGLLQPAVWVVGGAQAVMERVYPVVLRGALRRPAWVLVVSALCLGGAAMEVPNLGAELIPPVHQGEFQADVALPVGSPLARTVEAVRKLEKCLERQSRVETYSSAVGAEERSTTSSAEGEHTGRIHVRLRSGPDPAAQEQEVMQALRDRAREIPGLESLTFHRPVLFTYRTPIEVEVRGHDLEDLARVGREMEGVLAGLPGLRDVESNLRPGRPEVHVIPRRDRLAEYGIQVGHLAEVIRRSILGDVATRFRRPERREDIRIRLPDREMQSLGDLASLVVFSGGEAPIRLDAVADLELHEGPSEIRHVDHERAVVVSASLAGEDLESVSRRIRVLLRDIRRGSGTTFFLSGQREEMDLSLRSLRLALWLSLFLVYGIMASQFESLRHPFVILFTLPLAGVGVVPALDLAGISLSVITYIGFITLAGIVVNNAIVLVDCINRLRRDETPLQEAIVLGAMHRFRPILMTTATTLLGLIPLALAGGAGEEIRVPLAVTVAAGLVSSTLLTLLVIPVVYLMVSGKTSGSSDPPPETAA